MSTVFERFAGQAQADVLHPGAAVGRGNGNADQTQGRHLRKQTSIELVSAIQVADARRHFPGRPIRNGALEHLLLVCELEAEHPWRWYHSRPRTRLVLKEANRRGPRRCRGPQSRLLRMVGGLAAAHMDRETAKAQTPQDHGRVCVSAVSRSMRAKRAAIRSSLLNHFRGGRLLRRARRPEAAAWRAARPCAAVSAWLCFSCALCDEIFWGAGRVRAYASARYSEATGLRKMTSRRLVLRRN